MDFISEIYEKNKKYKYIKEIHFSRTLDSEDGLLYDMELILSDFPCESSDTFTINFKGLHDIDIFDLNNCLAFAITIEDVSSHQLEGIRYKVTDAENELFSFFCNFITITK
ncbi:MAG: hypothetical protein IKJ60_07785 [Ruminococcus sp.]|jgi:hypothetical protein|nr:hypothetical protein [Ruminococcus sp.]MBR3901431.1 hypothetical protein [Ruminococcus sp.]